MSSRNSRTLSPSLRANQARRNTALTFGKSRGYSTGFELLTPDQLAGADDIWLVSSVRLAAPVRELNGVHRPVDVRFANEMNAWLVETAE